MRRENRRHLRLLQFKQPLGSSFCLLGKSSRCFTYRSGPSIGCIFPDGYCVDRRSKNLDRQNRMEREKGRQTACSNHEVGTTGGNDTVPTGARVGRFLLEVRRSNSLELDSTQQAHGLHVGSNMNSIHQISRRLNKHRLI